MCVDCGANTIIYLLKEKNTRLLYCINTHYFFSQTLKLFKIHAFVLQNLLPLIKYVWKFLISEMQKREKFFRCMGLTHCRWPCFGCPNISGQAGPALVRFPNCQSQVCWGT